MSISIWMLIARIALALCLYGFLALVLFTLWRDLRAAPSPSPKSARKERIRWLGPDIAPPRTFGLEKESCLIGRSPTVEIVLPDETVSAVHARVWKSNGRWWLEDLDSRNGTFLNEIPVDGSAVLCAGDKIRIGRCMLEFAAEDSSTAPCPPPAGESSLQEPHPPQEIP